jgi:hypothetical protein
MKTKLREWIDCLVAVIGVGVLFYILDALAEIFRRGLMAS